MLTALNRFSVSRLRFPLIAGVLFLMVLVQSSTVFAHASFVSSSPAPNALLDTPPVEIRVWFTEPLEPDFSRMVLRDGNGQVVETPPAEVMRSDATQMFVRPGALPAGIYTVSWRVVSAADGHPTEGSFAFGVRTAVSEALQAPGIEERVSLESAGVRWLNLLSFSLLVGTLGFSLFVWQPSNSAPPPLSPGLTRLAWIGWGAVGVTGVLMLVLQVTTAAGVPFPTGIVGVDLGSYLLNTVHGRLWLMRTSLWFFIGTLLDMRRVRLSLWGALILSAALTLTHSLFSHAAAAEDQIAAVAGTWLHLMVSSLWIGGLVAFAFTLWQQRHDRNAQAVGQMIAHFSNYARIGVAGLVLTGAYAGWLHVGSPDGLLNTVYGRALLIKLALFLPLLVLAAYNLFFTARGLARGEEIWVGRLRSLVRAEIALAALILVAAAVLTAVPPSRTVLNARAAVPVLPEINPYEAVEVAGAVSYHLEIDPGFVGENTFIVAPFDANGSPITDVSRIRLRFDNLDQPSGQSELRPEAQDGAVGLFTASGTNLSTPGRWRVRMTVQRPDEFDQVVDYQVNVSAPPSLVIPEIDPSLPLDQRWLLAALTALGLIGIGVVGAVAFTERLYRLNLRILLPMMLLVVGMIFAASAVTPFARASVQPTARDAWVLPALESGTAAVYLTIENPGVLPERLIGASTEVAERVEIHEDMVMEEVAHMMWHSSVEIPAGGTLVLAQDDAAHGYHLMLTVLTRDLKEGEGFPLTLRFENGRTITTEVTVRLPLD